MIYRLAKETLLDLLRAPRDPPAPPPGTQGSVQVFRAAPNFLRLQFLVWGGGFATAVAIEVGFILFGHVLEDRLAWVDSAIEWAVLSATVLAGIGKYFLIRLDFDMRYYVVSDRSLRIREGALLIHESTFTYANVQNLRIVQGPVERLLGLSNLVVETAGGAGGSREDRGETPFRRGHQGVLRGVANAREVRDRILELLRRYRDAGLGDPEERRHAAGRRGNSGLPPAGIERLREIRDELRALRSSLRRR